MTLRTFDTNALSQVLRDPGGRIAKRLRGLVRGEAVLSIVVLAEVEFGIAKSGSKRIRANLDALKLSLPVAAFEEPADRIYGELRAELARIGKIIGPNDLLIAAHALALDAVLVTDDEEFSRVPGLKTENWLREQSPVQGSER